MTYLIAQDEILGVVKDGIDTHYAVLGDVPTVSWQNSLRREDISPILPRILVSMQNVSGGQIAINNNQRQLFGTFGVLTISVYLPANPTNNANDLRDFCVRLLDVLRQHKGSVWIYNERMTEEAGLAEGGYSVNIVTEYSYREVA